MSVSQEHITCIKIAKNYECKNGKTISIGNTTKRLGGLNEEQFQCMRSFGIEVAKQVGIDENSEIVKEIFGDESFQEELNIDSKFCNEYWYVRREFEVAKYFALKKDIMDELLEIMVSELKEGIKDSFNEKKVYKLDITVDELKKFIVDYETLKKELGL